MAVSKTKSNNRRVAKKQTVKEIVQPVMDIEVEDENELIFEDDTPSTSNETIKEPVVEHSYDKDTGHFMAEKQTGEKLDMFMPTNLPNDYCIIVRKFIDLNTAISVGNHCAGTHKSMDYKDFEALDDNSVDYAHCYNIISDFGVDRLQMVLSKMKHGGKCLVTDEKVDLTKILNNMVGIYTRVCGYGYKLFNHRYWFDHKNMSIALIIKG